MKEIAAQLGVSISSVSLVLNHRDKGRVKPEIAQKIRETAAKMDYRTNPLATSLRTGHSKLIGFISEDVATTPYAGELIYGAQQAGRALGYSLMIVNLEGDQHIASKLTQHRRISYQLAAPHQLVSSSTDDISRSAHTLLPSSLNQELEEIKTLKEYGMEGFVYARMYTQLTDLSENIAERPSVVVNGISTTSIPSIAPDEFHIGYQATEFLLRKGCKRIAYLGNSENIIAQPKRLEGYQQALLAAGIEIDDDLITEVLEGEDAVAKVSRLFDKSRPDGVFCFNDARAWYVYDQAAKRNLQIGKDLRVVGVDNHRLIRETFWPRLSTVALPHFEMGLWGVAKVVSMIEKRRLSVVINQIAKHLQQNGTDLDLSIANLPISDTDGATSFKCKLLDNGSA